MSIENKMSNLVYLFDGSRYRIGFAVGCRSIPVIGDYVTLIFADSTVLYVPIQNVNFQYTYDDDYGYKE